MKRDSVEEIWFVNVSTGNYVRQLRYATGKVLSQIGRDVRRKGRWLPVRNDQVASWVKEGIFRGCDAAAMLRD